MTLSEKALLCVEALEKCYPEAECSLEALTAFQLLAATRLSAQCTDARVNTVTPLLFEKYPTAEAMMKAELEDIEAIIRPCGFYHTKARDLIAMSRMLCEKFDGQVPSTIEELTSLPGVGRKTANLICGDVFGQSAVVADTHLIRLSNLLGLVKSKDPLKVELSLRELLPEQRSNDFCHRAVMHGRAVCIARRPRCAECCLSELCDFAKGEGRA